MLESGIGLPGTAEGSGQTLETLSGMAGGEVGTLVTANEADDEDALFSIEADE